MECHRFYLVRARPDHRALASQSASFQHLRRLFATFVLLHLGLSCATIQGPGSSDLNLKRLDQIEDPLHMLVHQKGSIRGQPHGVDVIHKRERVGPAGTRTPSISTWIESSNHS